ncbi:MAG: OmpH family outer membrane protein [Rikenellaceae bacterium]
MKKLLLVASAAAMMFAVGCADKNQTVSTTAPAAESVASSDVAYFNIDSLVSGYNMYLDLRTSFESKATKADSDLTAKGRSLENDVRSYQEKVQKGLVTRAQAAELEQQLTTKQQTFVQQRDQVLAELSEEEQVMLNNIHYSITEYLKEFNKDYRYGIIISTNASGPVYNANPKLDITADVLKGLNEKYAATKK